MQNQSIFKPLAILGAITLLQFVSPLRGAAEETKVQATEPAEYVIEDIQGTNVQVLEKGETKWESAQEGQVLESGDEVKAGNKSDASLMLHSETSVHLRQNSDMKVDQIEANPTGGFLSRLQLLAGQILSDVKKNLQESHSTFEVESNGVVCGVRGTAFEVSREGEDVQTLTHEGKVELKKGDQIEQVKAGNAISFKNGKFVGKRTLTKKEVDLFQDWRTHLMSVQKKREARLEAVKNGSKKPFARKSEKSKTKKKHQHKPIKRLKKKKIDPVNQ